MLTKNLGIFNPKMFYKLSELYGLDPGPKILDSVKKNFSPIRIQGQKNSVPDPGCLSRIPDPDFYPSRISDPGSKNSSRREGCKKICYFTFFCSHKFHKIGSYFIFEMLKKKIWAKFQRIIEVFTQKIFTKLSKIWVWDPGFGKNLFRIPDPGVKMTSDPGSGSARLQKTLVPRSAFATLGSS
jgi:hypothetical protein